MRFLILLVCAAAAVAQPAPPLVVVLGGNRAEWQSSVAGRGWRLAPPLASSAAPLWTDVGAKSVETLVEEARKQAPTGDGGAFLIGVGDGATAAFFLASRLPDLWRGVLAIEGSPQAAIDSNRFYAGNTLLVPIRWVVRPESQPHLEPLGQRLRAAGVNVEMISAAGLTMGQILDWLSAQHRDRWPLKVDCETGSPAFARCYWVEMTKFDPAQRNDAVPSTRVAPGAGAVLAFGPFGFDPSAAGPGVVVGWLPPGYRGPLKIEDRIVAMGGKPLRDAREYVEMMNQVKEEKPVAVTLLRGKQRLRVETRLVLPTRGELVTARVEAEYLVESHEIQVLSRTVAALRLRVPAAWSPVSVTWNGQEAGKIEGGGCWDLSDEGGVKLRPCAR
jgi:pimeloyl-ACP methyl ester carboxylesterase